MSDEGTLQQVEKHLRFSIKHWVSSRNKLLKRPVVVLDWGCGRGDAITEIGSTFGESVKAIGFGKDIYPEWNHNPNATFIAATKEDLFRYLKNGSVDLIYSSIGLKHILFPPADAVQYIGRLCEKLAPGGALVFDWTRKSHIEKDSKMIKVKNQRFLKAVLGPSFRVLTTENGFIVKRKRA
ncbi:MAG: class I SAM-dependent methyltransferase [Candidatus Diapherotrites archaeon]|nr:class I SAM-dependent methyltransferase [Candidatus Diapherotrites archaeon]